MKQCRLIITMILIFFISFIFAKSSSKFKYFITKENNLLMQGEEVFRFISYNIPNLNFVEDELTFTRKHAYGLPTEYEIRDALESTKQMGGRVVRTYTIPVRKQNENENIPKYVLAPGEFNEEAFQCMDTMLAVANQVGIRLIVPLLNNWKWMGGRPQYAAFRDKPADEFWTDPQLREDFKKTIEYVLNRKNTVTGVKYKNDRAILCWETGNELQSPQEWTHVMIEYIKSIDKNHLVMDGRSDPVINDRVINDPVTDIVTTHHYESNPEKMLDHINQSIKKVKNSDKAYIIGEFGFFGTPAIEKVLNTTISQEIISGSLIWSLRYHREKGGFYWHSEPLGRGIFKAYHWPGFPSGEEYDERNLLELMREKAFEIQNKPIPERYPPSPATLLPIDNIANIAWKGSAGASGYDIQRSHSQAGPWETIEKDISDASVQYYPIYHDQSAQIGRSYYYRIISKNKAGSSKPSNVVGPVKVEMQAIVDNMEDFMQMYHNQGRLRVATEDDRKFKEDMDRVEVAKNSRIVYYIPGNIINYKIFLFCQEEKDVMDVYLSEKGKDYKKSKTSSENYFEGQGDYGYWYPILYQANQKIDNKSYISLEFIEEAQISRVEIYYE
ncbi:MAG: cellulase family glycosylhydrolase [Candidatus Marinimicrobia bacterium]|nr:cellulase family glycosylhydrolase [Candidatus Neomarinimicrobiota bacterium]